MFVAGGKRAAELVELVNTKADRIEEIWNILEPVVGSEGMEILEIEYRANRLDGSASHFIDSENGAWPLTTAPAIIRVAGDVLDVADLIPIRITSRSLRPDSIAPSEVGSSLQSFSGFVEFRTIAPVGESRRNFNGDPEKKPRRRALSSMCDGQDHQIPLPLSSGRGFYISRP